MFNIVLLLVFYCRHNHKADHELVVFEKLIYWKSASPLVLLFLLSFLHLHPMIFLVLSAGVAPSGPIFCL